jgi:hypothetical protein
MLGSSPSSDHRIVQDQRDYREVCVCACACARAQAEGQRTLQMITKLIVRLPFLHMHLTRSAHYAEEFLQCTDIGLKTRHSEPDTKISSSLPSKKFEETPPGRNAMRSVFGNIKTHFMRMYCWALLRRNWDLKESEFFTQSVVYCAMPISRYTVTPGPPYANCV